MKFKYSYFDDADMDEEFTSQKNRNTHYSKHIEHRKEYQWTPDEYEKYADILQRTPIDNKKIFGYISERKDGRHAYCKYDKETELFVVYTYIKGEPKTITAFDKTWREYTGEKAIEYYDEIPQGK